MHLETDRITIADVTAQQLREELALLDLDTNTRAILYIDDNNFLQTAPFANGYILEKRQGNEDRHFHAVPHHAPLTAPQPSEKPSWWQRLFIPTADYTSKNAFTLSQAEEVFLAYLAGCEPQTQLTWVKGYSPG